MFIEYKIQPKFSLQSVFDYSIGENAPAESISFNDFDTYKKGNKIKITVVLI